MSVRPTLVFLPCWALGVLSFTHVCTSYIGFPLSNLSSPSANYVQFIHKVRDHKRKTKFDFRIYHLFLFELGLKVSQLCPISMIFGRLMYTYNISVYIHVYGFYSCFLLSIDFVNIVHTKC